ncbi:hypothetical protein HOU02_gp241 [Caulobacter phage CcrBL9]|uniref:Uncharacterized protein n=1 Tax=Caulobacter phage CcrBL9 TaxID=2283270 RepID=A0A385EC72_9CAUD|nr:hypothetical protein HOU02_gp241 [Caulobacter phage CcrBL9]AXQ69484.1 hypothetical protein CcrBL9_gp460 [Caulobacter phage CcrBL9]
MRNRAHQVLALLADASDEGFDDILCDGACYVGHVRISRGTVTELLIHMAISRSDEETERYTINSTGLAIHRRPALAPDILKAIGQGIAFTIDAEDQIKVLDYP